MSDGPAYPSVASWATLLDVRRVWKVTPVRHWRSRTWIALGAAGLAITWIALAVAARRPLSLSEALAALALVPACISASTDILTFRRHAAAATRPAGLLQGLDRLGDDSAIAVERLRVHRSVPLGDDVTTHLDRYLPTWVERDAAAQVLRWMGTARSRGGLLVVVGASSVGKTRMLYETAAVELGGWPVVAPGLGDGQAINALAECLDEMDGPVVLWLDELHRFVPGPWLTPDSIPTTVRVIGRLLAATHAVVILGSMWPEHLNALTVTRPGANGKPEPEHPEAADLLRHAEVVTLETFNATENDAALRLSSRDPRLAVAIDDPQFGVTQALAGVPALMQRYQAATEEEKALLHAAIDAQRLGVPPPLRSELLADAARGYLTGVRPTDDWIQPTLERLTRREGPHDRATAPLLAFNDSDHRHVIGYEVADYLLQYTARTRRCTPIPDPAWQAFANHIHNPDVLTRLAANAANRGLEQHTTTLLRNAAKTGKVTDQLANLLAERGDLGLLRAQADDGDGGAAMSLAFHLARRGDLDELRARTAGGDWLAGEQLVALLAEQQEFVELQALADSDVWAAQVTVAEMEAERGDLDPLRALADLVGGAAARILADRLAEDGDLEELRSRADAGDAWATTRLAESLAERGELDELRLRAKAGEESAAARLAAMGELAPLQALADGGNESAARTLAALLAEKGDLDPLRALADDDWEAALRLATLLAAQGDMEELQLRAEAGDAWAPASRAELLAKQGDLEELRILVQAGELSAVGPLIGLLVARGDNPALREEVDAGTPGALEALRNLEAGVM